MRDETFASPLAFLETRLGASPEHRDLADYEAFWRREGEAASAAVDRAGTPWVRMFDRQGTRTDEILLPPGYQHLLAEGYRAGALWRPFDADSLLPFFRLGYLAAFFDAGLCCPYTVSLATATAVAKYAPAPVRERFLPELLRRDGGNWQGATWMTEIKGGSDLGANVETVARPEGEGWRLSGEKYFASNAGAELAVAAARPEGAPAGVRGLALFLVPRRRADGSLNYLLRRLKDKIATRSVPTGEVELAGSEAYLLGRAEEGIYLILEVLNLSRVANAVGSVALAQRAIADAEAFARGRVAFGRPVAEQPLLRRQIDERRRGLEASFALAFEAVRILEEMWRARPPYGERHHLFRLLAHLAKYHTAEFAVQSAKWGMEVHGGLGVLGEFPAERWLREAMILAIWEGTPHRQILDGLEVAAAKGAHRLLFRHLSPLAEAGELEAAQARLEAHLGLPEEEREAGAEEVFADLARFTAAVLARGERPV